MKTPANTTAKADRQGGTAPGLALALPALMLAAVAAGAAPPTRMPLLRAPSGRAAVAVARHAPSAAARMNALGPENAEMAQAVGTWDVVETVWASPGAAPTSHKYLAERKMDDRAVPSGDHAAGTGFSGAGLPADVYSEL